MATTYDSLLKIPKLPKMRTKTAVRAQIYMTHLYMHGALTTEQVWKLSGKFESMREVHRTLKKNMLVKSQNRSIRLYKDGKWRLMNHLAVWQLTQDGVMSMERDFYDESDKWAYSSGKISRDLTSRRIERILRVAQLQAEFVAAGEKDFSFWDVAQMLSMLDVREKAVRGHGDETTNLWHQRPTLAGIIGIGNERIIGLSLYDSDTLNGLSQYLNRSFPSAFRRLATEGLSVGKVLVLTDNLYTKRLSVLSKLASRQGDLIVLPYEFSIDHPAAAVSVLSGNREIVMKDVILKYEFDGWKVERTNQVSELIGKEFYTYRATRDGVVEFFDTTFGTSIAQVESLFDHERFRVSGVAPGRRVLYVTSEREAIGIREHLKKKYPGKLEMTTEFRLLEL